MKIALNDIGVWSCGRRGSVRCPDKMLRSFGNTSLSEIFLKKAARINTSFFAGYDVEFRNLCEENGVDFVQRSQFSSEIDGPASEIYKFLEDVDYPYLLQVNACLPFLRLETILDFLITCTQSKNPKFAVFPVRNYFCDKNGDPFNYSKSVTTLNTKVVDEIYEFAHCFYFFEREYFLEHGWFWNWEELELIEIPKSYEFLDIDDEHDFWLAEKIYKES